MERMTKIDENIQTAQNMLSGIIERCYELEEENRKLKDSNTILMKGGQAVFTLEKRIDELLEENKKLKSDLHFERTMLDNVRAEYDSLQNVIKELKEENEDLKQIIKLSKSYEEGKNKLKEVYIKNTAKFLDKKFPKINGFMEEDTLQELRDLGEI